ncbi:hypothetical protein RB614_29845 [Phytohabitans sp. ZYX-F-186]|uniref:Uncharacterized protein n=1 Tax=Phytohabitans maris TaxID=3071409 RepID=A0ABU0ZNX8_9ACTN|nr:hypothetical protein [Phytohabitans sp. ZYX-F-186]MDQ7908742.1 hypothetical protein [Phytohabitans sp. ZYX-F-186]
MFEASLGVLLVLTLLAFVGWTGYRAALVGGACLVLAGGGLALQEMVRWMPADQAELLTYQFGTVAVAAVVAIPFGMRRFIIHGYASVFTAGVFAAVSFGILLFAELSPFTRVVVEASMTILVLIAADIVGSVWLSRRAADGTHIPIRRLWRSCMLIALAGILANAVGGTTPWLWLALGSLFLSIVCFATAVQLAIFTVILVRNGPYARAWAVRSSRTRRATTVDLLVCVAAAAGALTLVCVALALPEVVQPPAPVVIALLVGGVACIIAGGQTLVRVLDRAAYHKFHPEAPASPRVASALRGLARSEPVYRLLPGIAERS